MTNYIVCPECGYKLFKLGDGSNAEIYCPKYKLKLQIKNNDGKLTILKTYREKHNNRIKLYNNNNAPA